MQLAAAGHLQDDVAAAHQLAADVQLRDGRPVAVGLDAFADFRIGQYVHVRVLRAGGVQCRHRLGREAALRRARIALHEQDDGVGGQQRFDAGAQGRVEGHGGIVAYCD
jgi:hypothetical protein